MSAMLQVRGVSKSFGAGATRRKVLDGVDFDVERGEFLAIVGCSGAGKSTLLSLLAGLSRPDSGTIQLDGREVVEPGTDRAIVFQHYSLLPWLTVAGNVRLAVEQVFPTEPPEARERRVERMLELVGLAPARRKFPSQLSGGMKQRVAVARALAMDPAILLLDEPFGALDALTRGTLQVELERIWEADQKTVVMITNDVDEALLLADHILLLTADGRLDAPIAVDLPRPRDRDTFEHDPRIKRMRLDLADRLRAVGTRTGESGRHAARANTELPTVRPDHAREREPSANATRFLALTDVAKVYDTPHGRQVIVDEIDLALEPGEFVSIIGHSGCGKTTVMSMIAGLTEPTAGTIELAGARIERPGPERAMVFQAHALLPWFSARENVLLGVDRSFSSASPAERAAIADFYLERVGLAEWKDAKPSQLSAGMRQRVGVARAFALAPKLLLLDEPFGSLDSVTRADLQDVLLELWSGTRTSALLVTHDVDEALFLSDRIVLMTDGPAAVIGDVVRVPFARPRDRRTLAPSSEYQELRDRILRFLEHTSSRARTEPERTPRARTRSHAKLTR
ncbi:MAG: ATP-binding cassette domain-containing protein [Planctomycetes bacterium]|nr:ATP-binding cassette domain-containing protein [Planctomycetota bacterium]